MAAAGAFAGAEFVDRRALCPTSGEVCPALETVVRLYEDHVSPDINITMPREAQSRYDGPKLTARLGEYSLRANIIDCPGANGDDCPTRMNMDDSPVRTGIVKTLRKVLEKTR